LFVNLKSLHLYPIMIL